MLGDYKLGKIIGHGAYAFVRLATHKDTNKKVAIKIYEKNKLGDSMKKKAVQREIIALSKIEHPNIIKMLDLVETNRQICIVMDYVNGMSLHSYIKIKCSDR